MNFFSKKTLSFILAIVCTLSFTNVIQAGSINSFGEEPKVIQLKIIGYSNDEDSIALEPTSISYIDKLNLILAENEVPFQYLTYEYGDGKFTTYPFNLINEELPTITGPNPNYDERYDRAFQKMISKLVNSADITNKQLYAMGSQNEGEYIQDIETNEKYVLNQICFDNKCTIGQVFFIFNPKNYEMTGILYDGCSFLKNIITGSDKRTKLLLQRYINSQDPLDYSYAPNACKKSLSVTRGK